jgi:hypothetical protein
MGKYRPEQLEHSLHLAHSKDLILDFLPPILDLLSRRRKLSGHFRYTVSVCIRQLFLAAHTQDGQ